MSKILIVEDDSSIAKNLSLLWGHTGLRKCRGRADNGRNTAIYSCYGKALTILFFYGNMK